MKRSIGKTCLIIIAFGPIIAGLFVGFFARAFRAGYLVGGWVVDEIGVEADVS
jgi:hypothetical protein